MKTWGLRGVFGGAILGLLSEGVNQYIVPNPLSQVGFAIGVAGMVAGSVALILSERKK